MWCVCVCTCVHIYMYDIYICMHVYDKYIHKCIYVCAYTEEKKKKKELALLQKQCLFFSKRVNFAVSTSFHILV